MSPAQRDEENLPELTFLRKEKSKDDTYLLGKHAGRSPTENELHFIEQEIAYYIDHSLLIFILEN
jgi:hypothetical protein